MTIEELKQSGHIIFEAISGSKAYGLATATSDTDIRGVFILPQSQYYGMTYIGQVNDATNDVVYYELRKFMELLLKNNPNMMELLAMPEDCILYKHPIFDRIQQSIFLSKLCKDTYANYAFSQIKKAQGLNKKIRNPMSKERKTILDFCYIHHNKQSVPLSNFLERKGMNPVHCGLSNIPHMKDCYNLFYNEDANYKGIAKPNANAVQLSNIAKEEVVVGLLYFNQDGYTSYCKRYKEYWSWVANRNEARYENNIAHEKNYDSKNMMHTFRLLKMAHEIATENTLHVRRQDREELLQIKGGHYEYDTLLERANSMQAQLEVAFEACQLPEQPNFETINQLLTTIRSEFYYGNP